jgi:hypothetical protein
MAQSRKCICSDCLASCELKKIRWVDTKSRVHHKPEFWYIIPVCETCFIEGKYELAYKDQKPVIDTSKWLEGKSTAKGTTRFYFLDKKGKKVLTTMETGTKNKYKPILK